MVNSDTLLRRLRVTLDRPDTILLIGSGVSLWSGLPSWRDLLIQLADYVESLGRDSATIRHEVAGGDLLLAASYGVHQLDLREFGAFIRVSTKHPNTPPAEIHRLIATLGPSCFITTNYDRLLETAVGQYSGHGLPLVVTNRQVAEIADILPGHSRKFVFKYHGDVEDAASIVLTRDQYRRIQHDYPATIRALETLLATRPVVMIGFGLRDLDFLTVKDELVSAFSGQVGEYFALMPDFSELQADYWRKTYRTEVISYDTFKNPDGTHDHRNLITLLKELQPKLSKQTEAKAPTSISRSDYVLQLARLAAAISRKRRNPQGEVLPLTVTTERSSEGFNLFHETDLERLIRNHNRNFLLLGSPGSGKTFALSNYATELATELLDRCIEETVDVDQLRVPVFIDLALYAGDLRNLIEDNLPTGLELSALLGRRHTTVIFDGTNEMPRAFIENGIWLTDIQGLISAYPNCRFILGSRNETWLSSLDLPRFTISNVRQDFVADELSRSKPEIRKNSELVRTLSKPLFFSLAKNDRINLAEVSTPADVYQSFFGLLDKDWRRDHPQIDFAAALESVAFGMITAGAEFAKKEEFELALSSRIQDAIQIEDAIAYLLAHGAIVAQTGHRISFFHQSATEYLAARTVAKQFKKDKTTLHLRLRDKRWDQALFLTMSFLTHSEQTQFIEELLAVDAAAAARAAHFLEDGRADIINRILIHASRTQSPKSFFDFEGYSRLAHQLESLPVTVENAKALQQLSKRSQMIGGAALGALFKIMPEGRRQIIDQALKKRRDFNYGQSFAGLTSSYWRSEDLIYLLNKLASTKGEIDASSAFGKLVQEHLPIEELICWVERHKDENNPLKGVLIEALEQADEPRARSALINLVNAGEKRAVFALYSNLKHHTMNLGNDELAPDVHFAERLIHNRSDDNWAIELAKALIEKRVDWRSAFGAVPHRDRNTMLLVDLVLKDREELVEVITSAVQGLGAFKKYCVEILGRMDFWQHAPRALVLAALSSRNAFLVGPILETIASPDFAAERSNELSSSLLEAKPLEWWLNWQEECSRSRSRTTFFCGWRLGQALRHDRLARPELLKVFNHGSVEDFGRVGHVLFNNTGMLGSVDISTDNLSTTAVNRLLKDGKKYNFSADALGYAATEEFVQSVLLPHWKKHPEASWVHRAIEIAGDRHNRRYLVNLADV